MFEEFLMKESDYECGKKVIVFGLESGSFVDCKVGKIIQLKDRGVVTVKFEEKEYYMHNADGLSKYRDCYHISNSTKKIYEYTEEIFNLIKKTINSRCPKKEIADIINKCCNKVNGECSICPCEPLRRTCGCNADVVASGTEIIYNTFLNAKIKLEGMK